MDAVAPVSKSNKHLKIY